MATPSQHFGAMHTATAVRQAPPKTRRERREARATGSTGHFRPTQATDSGHFRPHAATDGDPGHFGALKNPTHRTEHDEGVSVDGAAFRNAKRALADRVRSGLGNATGQAGAWARDTIDQYKGIHSNHGSVSDWANADTTKANARYAVGSTINNMLKQRMQRAAKKGGFISQTLWTFAHMAFQSTMRNLKEDQRTFEHVARVRRGDPNIKDLTHNELRAVLAHADKYGGKDKERVRAMADGELARRWDVKATEHAGYDAARRNKLDASRAGTVQAKAAEKEMRGQARAAESAHKQERYHQEQMRRNEDLHKQKLKHQTELRQVAGHGAGAKAATDVAVKQAGARKAAKDKPTKSREALQVVGKTRKGREIVKTKTGNTRVAAEGEVAKSRGARTKSVTPTRRTRR